MEVFKKGLVDGCKPSGFKIPLTYNGQEFELAGTLDGGDPLSFWWYIRKGKRGQWRNFDVRKLWKELGLEPVNEVDWMDSIIEAERKGDRLALSSVRDHLLGIGFEPIFEAEIIKEIPQKKPEQNFSSRDTAEDDIPF